MEKQKFSNILIVRTDRIGDVILTLPMISALKSNFPTARISMLLRSYTKELAEGQDGLSQILSYDVAGIPKGFFSTLSELRSARFDVAIIAFPRFRIALLMLLAGIPARVASGYRWYSFLFTHKVYEHRKTAEKHEAEYNLSLLAAIGCDIPSTVLPRLFISREDEARAVEIRNEIGLTSKDKVAVLHPGSGGSARDWKPENFSSLALELGKRSWNVVVTGGKGEETLVRGIVEKAGSRSHMLVGRLGLKELGAFIQTATVFVSNSTGPLHIAAAVGTPVVAFYPPIVVASPQRWGPLAGKKTVFVPDRNTCVLCKGGACRSNVCMDQISVEQALQAIVKLEEFSVTGKGMKGDA